MAAAAALVVAAAAGSGLAETPSPSPASAFEGDAALGREFARAICSECHQVAPDEPHSTPSPAPSFTTVATQSWASVASLQRFMRSPHASMPNIDFLLDEAERDDLVAYILSLKPKAAPPAGSQ